MWSDKIEQIKSERADFNLQTNQAASNAEIQDFIITAKEKMPYNLPQGYVDFLHVVNGLEYNSVNIYGIDVLYCEIAPYNKNLGLIEWNEAWYDEYTNNHFVYLGADDINWYVYNRKTNTYCVLDKPSPRWVFEQHN